MPILNEIHYGAKIGKRSHGAFIWVACTNCGKQRWVLLLHGKPKSKRCHSCANGGNGSNPLGPGVFRRRGYIFIRKPDHPSAVKGYVKRATLILEAKLGGFLMPGTIAHHLNGVRDDDRPENLVELSRSVHTSLHNKGREKEERKRDSRGRYLKGGKAYKK